MCHRAPGVYRRAPPWTRSRWRIPDGAAVRPRTRVVLVGDPRPPLRRWCPSGREVSSDARGRKFGGGGECWWGSLSASSSTPRPTMERSSGVVGSQNKGIGPKAPRTRRRARAGYCFLQPRRDCHVSGNGPCGEREPRRPPGAVVKPCRLVAAKGHATRRGRL